ncbi:AAA family ATPase [Chromobacterium haemolyticum]|uniref:AAA family ATPase n=1 Tax=Chromobacterium haemolyticum TaxID=394935 RepID=UPI0005BA1A86|nr:AAA family ATPase [Chromobacterium haemolyticum]QOD80747.1 AAA family ATPase [Chromobacterium haemolyticum]
MQSTNEEVRQWLLKQSDWLQEAADRLLKNGALSTADIQDLCAHLKTEQGRKATQHRVFGALAQPPQTCTVLRLKSIDALTGIEGLAPRHPLTFGRSNLTVVYGHNGSGKSSYARLLKKVTGKPRAIELKPNVFLPATQNGQCQITYELDEKSVPCTWIANSAPIEDLRAVDIFDTDEATHYLRNESAAAYTPPVVSLFENLAEVCDLVKQQLQAEEQKLVKALPNLPADFVSTGAGRNYSNLKAEESEPTLNGLLTWTNEDQAALDQVVERLKASDPSALAKQKRARKTQVQQVLTGLETAEKAFGTVGLESMRTLRSTAQSKRKIATESADVSAAMLENVGSSTWRAMWEAARAYSQEAYVASAFPVTDSGARCVLCHQELSEGAQQRLRSFEAFVQGKLETEARQAEATYEQAKNALPEVWKEELIETRCAAAGLTAGDWPQYLKAFWKSAAGVKAELIADEISAPATPMPDIAEALKTLTQYASQLDTEAAQHDDDAKGIDRSKLGHQKLELEAKQWVVQQADAVRSEVERLKKLKAYEGWKSSANSRSVSQKSAEVAEKVITQGYVKRFNRELQALGATRIKVELVKTKAEKGKVLHRLRLKDVIGKQIIDAVLSEGERRVVALAAFLADLTEKPSNASFIFDDPISSLDQTWEERTIERLVELSKTRQVIVFTHRLSFLGLINEKSEDVSCVHIRQESWGAGESGDVPLYGKKPESALRDLQNTRVNQARKVLQEQGNDAYYPLGKAICSDFRILLERMVEFVLLADVIQRHRRAVNTQGKIQYLAKILPSDCALIEELMSKYSRFEHSQSAEAPVELPKPDELSEDIRRVLEWHTEFSKRPLE